MQRKMSARLSAACLLVLALLAACGPNAAQQAMPTATIAPTEAFTATFQPTATTPPTETLAPTATGAQDGTPGVTPQATTAGGAQPATMVPPVGGVADDKYVYLGQDVKDGSQFLPNRTVTITWTVQNAGATTWTTDYMMRYFSGPKASQDTYNFTKQVPPEGTINFMVTFTTPSAPGDYDMWFKLTNASGQNFGDLNLVYTVTNTPGSAPTATTTN